jgi:hypothetical protein
MDDLTPEQLSGKATHERFHTSFGERFNPVTPLTDIDDSDSWGPGWRGVSHIQSLEG